LRITFETLDERQLGDKWRGQFDRLWRAHRAWYLREGDAARPTYMASLRQLKRHFPDFLPTYERAVELAGGGDVAARYLTQYSPPAFFSGCSQMLWTNGEPALVRNYDYSPMLCDGLIMKTAWNGRRVVAMTDGLIGVLDGMNEDGLAVSLAFGGRRDVGQGFGITFVLRNVLESCGNVAEATALLESVPVHVAYNVALIDRQGDFATVMLGPDRDPVTSTTRVSTNHQGKIEWPRYARLMQTEDRHAYLCRQLDDDNKSLQHIEEGFLQEPLYRNSYAKGYGTLYTAVYLPTRGEVHYVWPSTRLRESLAGTGEGGITIAYRDGTGAHPIQ
jgi:predicted choloylglycine hydrolase